MKPLWCSTLLLTAACGLGVGQKKEQQETHDLDLTTISAVQVHASDGNVAVGPTSDGAGSVTFTKKTSRFSIGTGSCHSEYHIDGTTLVVNVTEDSNASCEIDTQITVTATTPVTVSVDDGDIKLNSMQGSLAASSKDGNITADFAAQSGAAPVCNGTFASSDGNISVAVDFPPTAGSLSANTSDGNVTLGLAGGTSYQLNEHTEDGSFKNAVAATAGAKFAVALQSKDGDLKIKQN